MISILKNGFYYLLGMSNQWINGPDTTRGNLKVQARQGIVVGNGKIHDALVATAKISRNPYYAHAVGSTAENINFVKTGRIVFTLKNTALRNMSRSLGAYAGDYSKIMGVTSLNGLGEGKEAEDLMLEIEVLGFADMGTLNNGKDLFNIILGGSFTIENDSPYNFHNGDFGEVYAPNNDELKQHVLGTKDEINGEATLRIRPFHPENYNNTPKTVFKCLEDGANYDKQYRDNCEALIDSIIEMTVVVIATVEKNVNAENIYNNLKARRGDIINALFLQYSGDLPSNNPGSSMSEQLMEKFGRESIGKYMAIVGRMVHNVAKNVILRATSSSPSGHNLNIQMRNYAI